MRFAVEEITPERAAHDLAERNKNNYRRLTDDLAARYGLDMANGRWRVTGEPIIYDSAGLLADGQHRLAGCVKAGVPFTTTVVYDIEPDAVEFMDWGKKRSLENVLRRRGETNTMVLASACYLGYRWETDQLLAAKNPSPAEALEWLRLNPSIRDAVRIATAKFKLLVPAVSAGAVFVYRAQQLDPAEEVEFRHALLSGQSMVAGHPVFAYRNYMLTGRGAEDRPDAVHQLALLIKTWNATMQGRNVRQLFWRHEGVTREPFPAMIGKRAA